MKKEEPKESKKKSDEEYDSEEDESDDDDDEEEDDETLQMEQQKRNKVNNQEQQQQNKFMITTQQDKPKNMLYTDRLRQKGKSYSINNYPRQQAWLNQKNLQINFLEQENINMKKEQLNKEQNLKINKDLLQMLIQESKDIDMENKKIILKLNQENQRLIDSNHTLQKERDDLLAKQLIDLQIIENAKSKEDELNQMNEEQLKQLQETLEKKEYLLQVCELKIYHYEKYLQRKSLTDKEAINLLFKFQNDDPKEKQIKISNVIDENQQLKNELKEAFHEVNRTTEQVQQLNRKILDLEIQVDSYKNKQNNNDMSLFDQTYNSTFIENNNIFDIDKLKNLERFFPTEYKNKLETMVVDLEKQVQVMTKQRKVLKSENIILKESNENNIFVIQQLNQALQKSNSRITILEQKVDVNNNNNVQKKDTEKQETEKQETEKKDIEKKDENVNQGEMIIESLVKKQQKRQQELLEQGIDPTEFGNLSSIMINPNELSTVFNNANILQSTKGQGVNFNFGKEMEKEDKK